MVLILITYTTPVAIEISDQDAEKVLSGNDAVKLVLQQIEKSQ